MVTMQKMNMADLAADAEKAAKAAQTGDRINYVKLDLGVTTVRLLPVPQHEKYKRTRPYFPTKKHFGIKGYNNKDTSVSCAMDLHGECPICEEAQRLYDRGDKDAKERAGRIRAQEQHCWTVLNIDGEPALLYADKKCHAAILGQISLTMRSEADFDPFDLEKGCWLDIKKEKGPKQGNFAPNVFTATFHRQSKAVPAALLKAYSSSYIFPEAIERIFLPSELQQVLDGDWSFFEKYKKEADEKATSFDHGANVKEEAQVEDKAPTKKEEAKVEKKAAAKKDDDTGPTAASQTSKLLDDILMA